MGGNKHNLLILFGGGSPLLLYNTTKTDSYTFSKAKYEENKGKEKRAPDFIKLPSLKKKRRVGVYDIFFLLNRYKIFKSRKSWKQPHPS